MQMEAGLDTGPVLLTARTAIDGMTAGALTDVLSALGARLMVEALGNLGAFPPIAQPIDGVTYAAKIDKAEARIDWAQPADAIERQARAFNPVPGAFFDVAGERIKLLAALSGVENVRGWRPAGDGARPASHDRLRRGHDDPPDAAPARRAWSHDDPRAASRLPDRARHGALTRLRAHHRI